MEEDEYDADEVEHVVREDNSFGVRGSIQSS